MHRHVKILFLTLLGLVFIIGILAITWYVKSSHEAAHGTLSSDVLTAPDQEVSFNATPKLQKGSYASFSYPASMQPTTGGQLGGSTLSSYVYMFEDVQEWKLAVSVVQYPTAGLSADSGYVLRTLRPSQYAKTEQTLKGINYTIMTDVTATGFSQVAYAQNGTKIGEISLTGNDQNGLARLQQTFIMVLSTWRWN